MRKSASRVNALWLALCLLLLSSACVPEATYYDDPGIQVDKGFVLSEEAPASATYAPLPLGVKRYRFCFTGDIMCHDRMIESAYDSGTATYDFIDQFTEIAAYLEEADYSIGNLETSLGKEEDTYTGFPEFNAPPSLMEAVEKGGFDMVTFANNHATDQGQEGVSRTIALAEAAGVRITGAFDDAHAQRYEIIDLPDLRFAVLAYTPYLSENSRRMANYFDLGRIAEDIANARAEGAELVIVCCHWGVEYDRSISSSQRRNARKLVELGVDAIIGHHPHVLQEIEMIAGVPVAYSLGNFVANQPVRYRSAGLILELSFLKDLDTGEVRLDGVRGLPTYCWRAGSSEKFSYRVLPAALAPPEGMRNSDKRKMREAHQDTVALLTQSGIEEWRIQ